MYVIYYRDKLRVDRSSIRDMKLALGRMEYWKKVASAMPHYYSWILLVQLIKYKYTSKYMSFVMSQLEKKQKTVRYNNLPNYNIVGNKSCLL